MPRILIDARAIADPNAGGVGRVARLWILEIVTGELDVTRYPLSVIRTESTAPTDHGSPITDHEFLCITTGLSPSATVKEFCDKLGVRYLHLRIPNKIWTLGCWLKIFALDRAAEKKVGPIDRVFLPNLGFTGKLTRPYELLLHDVSFAIEPRWFTWRMRLWHRLLPIRKLITNAEKLHCVSQRTSDDTVRLYGVRDDKCEVFKFDAALPAASPIRPSWLPQSALRYVLLMGGADPRKNVETALCAITEFNFKHPDQSLVPIVLGGHGKGNCPKGGPCVRPPAKVTDAELHFLYANALAFLYPSWYEGYGLPLHEAKSHQTPCVASTAGALPETTPQGTIFCHPAKPHEWLAALELIVASRDSATRG